MTSVKICAIIALSQICNDFAKSPKCNRKEEMCTNVKTAEKFRRKPPMSLTPWKADLQ